MSTTGQPIPSYGEDELRTAREVIERAEADERHGWQTAIEREVAGAVAAARAEGFRDGVAAMLDEVPNANATAPVWSHLERFAAAAIVRGKA